MDRGEFTQSTCLIDDYDDEVTSAEESDVCPTPPAAISKLHDVDDVAGIVVFNSDDLSPASQYSTTDSIVSLASSSDQFGSQHVSPDLLLASQQLSYARDNAEKGKRKLDRVQEFVAKVSPFNLNPEEPLRKFLETKRARMQPSTPIQKVLEGKIAELESIIKNGDVNYKSIMKEFEAIEQERKVKDETYTKKIASTFNIPETSVKDIIQAYSD
jgi:DNA repair ATPase RecN